MSYLIVRSGNTRKILELKNVTTIGRSSSCDIVLEDLLASKLHAEIRESGDRYILHDFGSTNGTFIGGQRVVNPISLQDGDEILVGDVVLIFTRSEPADAPEHKELRSVKPNPSVVSMPLERMGLHWPGFVASTLRAIPSSAGDMAVWLRSLYRLLREANQCQTEDTLLSLVTRVLTESLTGIRVRILFEAEPATKGHASTGHLIPWTDPEHRQQRRTTRVVERETLAVRDELVEFARSRCAAVLSPDIDADPRGARKSQKAKPQTGERISIIIAPLLTGRVSLGYLCVERNYRVGSASADLENGPLTQAHLEFLTAAAYPLALLLGNLTRANVALGHNQRLQRSAGQGLDIIGESKTLKKTMTIVEKVAPSSSTVVVMGESGTGKELVARAIHRLSGRQNRPFVAVNCGALAENLVESELFGHSKGAFTGAVAERSGCFEEASGGTLFLDEIGELPLQAQVKLLRVLQEGKVVRVGENRLREVNCRIVAATNRNLEEEVRAGRFRQDLLFRLKVVDLTLPPLRDRLEDLPVLCRHVLQQYGNFLLHPDVIDLFSRYRWPGNIRELRNVLERMAVLARPATAARSGVIPLGMEDVPLDIRGVATSASAGGEQSRSRGSVRVLPAYADAFIVPASEITPLDKLQVEYARWALKRSGGNKTKAAKALGIQRATLYAWTEWEDEARR